MLLDRGRRLTGGAGSLSCRRLMGEWFTRKDPTFDPQVVAVLQRRYAELEKMAKEQPREIPAKLRSKQRAKPGARPAAGFAGPGQDSHSGHAGELRSRISFARKQCNEIVHISERFEGLINIEDLGAIISLRLKRTIWYDALALYCVHDGALVPAFVIGKNSEVFVSLCIPLGEGLTGWVAQNRRPVLNGNPSVEPGYVNNSMDCGTMRSALVVPLEGQSGLTAVLALYRVAQDAFTGDDLRVLEAIRPHLGGVVCETQRPKAFEASSGS